MKKNKTQEHKFPMSTLIETDEFIAYRDILSVFFNAQDLVTKSEVRKVLKQHLEREV